MSRWMRAFLIATTATAAAALVLRVLPGWKDAARPSEAVDDRRTQTRQDVIDELSDVEKEQMLRELGQHV